MKRAKVKNFQRLILPRPSKEIISAVVREINARVLSINQFAAKALTK